MDDEISKTKELKKN